MPRRIAAFANVRPLLLAAAGGVLHFLGFAGFGIWPLALVCLVPLWLAFEAGRDRAARAALAGFVFGWVSYAGGYLWMWRIVDVFLGGNVWLGAAVWAADATWFAARYALYGLLYAWLRRRGAAPLLAGVPALVVVEWLYPMLFPVYLGHALADRAALVQLAALGGPLLLTAYLGLLDAAAFDLWRGWRGDRPGGAVVVAALAASAAAWGYGQARLAEVDRLAAGAGLRVGIVQGNLGVQEKGVRAERDHQRYLAQTRELLADGPLDLVVWPETVYTRGLRGPLPVSGALVRGDVAVPLLFGGAFVRGDSGRRRVYNAALLVDGDGRITSGYEKNLLIPFTEYVPLAGMLPGLAARATAASHFDAASAVPPLVLGGVRIATPICYEVVRPDFVRRMMREGRPQLIATLANDAWFGDSQEPLLHLAMARMRAVEHGRYLVRATNSGISAIVDPAGRVVARTGLLTRESLRGVVAPLDTTTPYTRFGDWVGWVSAGLLAWVAWRPRR